jgi:hypothetical protein
MSPAHADPPPHSHTPATAPEMREMVEYLIEVRMRDLPTGRGSGSSRDRFWILTNFCSIATVCIG